MTDGGRDEDDSPPSATPGADRPLTKAEQFHEKSGSFKDVGKAVLILILLGLLAYVVFVVL